MIDHYYATLSHIPSAPDPITALSQFFYQLICTVTEEERMSHRNFYARFRYFIATTNLTDAERRNLDAFRRFIKQHKADERSLKQGLLLMENLLNRLYGNELVNDDENYFSRLYPVRDSGKTIRVLCESWTEASIRAYDLEDMDTAVNIQLSGHEYMYSLLLPNALLLLQHVIKVDDGYVLAPDALVVLEPDFLLDASAIGECFGKDGAHPGIFLLSRLVEDLPGGAALKGSMIGYYLDEMMRQETIDTDLLFREAQRSNALKAAQLGSTEMQQIKHAIRNEHLPKLEELVNRERHKEVWIEPTYFSADYGLQGRLDLLAINKNKEVKDIIELKSGSPANYSIAWINHRMQVVSYDLLLRSTYGNNRQGYNAVFYSKCDSAPYRNIVSDHAEWSQVLKMRNLIVARLYKLAGNDFTALQSIKQHGIPGLPRFSEARLERFKLVYEPVTVSTQYYQELLAFTLREMINAKVGHFLRLDEVQQHGFASLWQEDVRAKESGFRVLSDLQVTTVDERNGFISLNMTRPIPHAFRQGDLVILYPRTDKGYDCLSQHILKGSVKSLGNNTLTVSINNKQTAYGFIYSHEWWAIEPDLFERNYWSSISCLFNILTASDRKKKLLLGHIAPIATPRTIHCEQLTLTQQQTIRDAVAADDYYLLQGPPGTGKTSTFLVNYIRESAQGNIMVLAFTNNAVEEICKAFKQVGQAYLRLGSRHVEDEQLFTALLADDEPDNWRGIINSHRIIVSTVSTFQNNWLLLRQLIPFKHVVIDEASQLTEADLAGILSLFEKFVLIGDQQQLPAVVTQHAAACHVQAGSVLERFGIKDLQVSLFERLMNNAVAKGWTHAYGQLTDHYRMHEHIAALIAGHYNSKLVAVKERQCFTAAPYSLPAGHAWEAVSRHRAVFVNCEAPAGDKRNTTEAVTVAALVTMLIREAGIDALDIGVITPFRAQIAEIRNYLPEEPVLIDTVERFQGAQRKIIIYSATITHASQLPVIQHLTAAGVDRKLLVALSRAEEQVIILGHAAVLSSAPAYRELIERSFLVQSVFNYPGNQRQW